jgi:hypothetical protein
MLEPMKNIRSRRIDAYCIPYYEHFRLPMHFELAINIKTAKSLGLRFPRAILIRADEVIQ